MNGKTLRLIAQKIYLSFLLGVFFSAKYYPKRDLPKNKTVNSTFSMMKPTFLALAILTNGLNL